LKVCLHRWKLSISADELGIELKKIPMLKDIAFPLRLMGVRSGESLKEECMSKLTAYCPQLQEVHDIERCYCLSSHYYYWM